MIIRLPFRRCFPWRITSISRSRTLKNVSRLDPKNEVDSFGLPTKPLWSVNALLSSYPEPELSASTFKLLHELSALTPPEEGTPQYVGLKRELEELIRLVEAVRLVNTQGIQPVELRPLLRDGAEEDGDLHNDEETEDLEMGRALLKYASRTSDDFYVVEADKKR
ncbi:hypothetical protein J3R30DRAFT_1044184 [Lentinula aciculospora]|uniref:Uncharacterized protein n=1 Tax=Lentinula aciculospora TaxID=153920 RepID=A0A9W9A195_9AGAR|nr:hypothetical protein J3R30DRAFT_1044184 [Lentinula aciculospora]